jgi:hypothetical protein
LGQATSTVLVPMPEPIPSPEAVPLGSDRTGESYYCKLMGSGTCTAITSGRWTRIRSCRPMGYLPEGPSLQSPWRSWRVSRPSPPSGRGLGPHPAAHTCSLGQLGQRPCEGLSMWLCSSPSRELAVRGLSHLLSVSPWVGVVGTPTNRGRGRAFAAPPAPSLVHPQAESPPSGLKWAIARGHGSLLPRHHFTTVLDYAKGGIIYSQTRGLPFLQRK